MLKYIIVLLLSVLVTGKLIPPSINYLGCDNNFNIDLLNENECNKVIKGKGYPDSTISIYSTHYLEQAGSSYLYPNQYVNLGSVQSGTFDPKLDPYNNYKYYFTEIVNGSIETNMWYFWKYDEFLSSGLIELYDINNGCIVAIKETGEFLSFGKSNNSVDVYCQNGPPPYSSPVIAIENSMFSYISVDSNSTSKIYNGYPSYYIVSNNTKSIFAGGYQQYAVLEKNNKLIVMPYGYGVNHLIYYNVNPRFIVFTETGGGFINPDGQFITWNMANLQPNDIPQVIVENIRVDSNGNWNYKFTDKDLSQMINQDAQHLIIQSFYQDKYSGKVSYPETVKLNLKTSYSIPSVKFDVEPDGYISGTSIPNTQILLYSIGKKDYDYFGPLQYGCNIGACAQIIDGSVVVTGDPKLGGDITSVKSFVSSGIVELYVIYNGAFVAIKESGELISWGSKDFGGGKYLDNVIQVATNTNGFIALLSNGNCSINGDEIIYDRSSQFYMVYAGGTNIFAAITVTDRLHIWNNGDIKIYNIEKIQGVGYQPILTDWVCGIIYDNGKLITYSYSYNYINENDIPRFITNDIYSDSNGFFKYQLTQQQINNYNKLGSSYLMAGSKNDFIKSSLTYSKQVIFG